MKSKSVDCCFLLALLFSVWLIRLINPNLGLIVNVIHIVNTGFDVVFPIANIADDDDFSIWGFRYVWEKMPKRIEKMADTKEFNISDHIKVRVYFPRQRDLASTLSTLIIYYHGGGFVIGSLAAVEHITTGLALRTNFTVASVAYRLAPEFKFPTAHEDCLIATKWLLDHAQELGVDKMSVVVAGDSAGANIAAIVAQRYSASVAFQLLVYPALPSLGSYSLSAYQNRVAPLLNTHLIEWFKHKYFQNIEEFKSELACPAKAASLANLPPALIITAEVDILRDEGEEYARMLITAGNNVTIIRYNNTVHGFYGHYFLNHGVRALDESATHLVNFFNEEREVFLQKVEERG